MRDDQMSRDTLFYDVHTINGTHLDVLIREGVIAELRPHQPSETLPLHIREQVQEGRLDLINGEGDLLAPSFVDSHFHLDSTLSLGLPRLNVSGTLFEGIQIWAEQKPQLTEETVYQRASELIQWAIARGTLAMRSHVDIGDEELRATRALIQLRDEVAPYFDLQLVAFPQDGYLRNPRAEALLVQALDLGVDLIGGIPHFERSNAAGRESIERLCRLAADRGLRVDMHCDETDDPQSRHIETLAEQCIRFGLQGRVTASHVTSLASAPNDFAAKLVPLLSEANVHVVANPLINITLQGRRDGYPRRRGMTRVDELAAGGVNISFGHDCVMDPWYALGSADMLEVAQMGLHVGQMTSLEGMRTCFNAVTQNPALALGLRDEFTPDGFKVGDRADLVLLEAGDPIEAIRLRATRKLVMSRGQIVARSPSSATKLTLPGKDAHSVYFRVK